MKENHFHRVKRKKDAPRINFLSNEACTRKFDPEQDEFVVPASELAVILRDANMDYVGLAPTQPPQKVENAKSVEVKREP